MNLPKTIVLALIFGALGSCSFRETPTSTRAMFTFPDVAGNSRPLANYACLNVWGPDGRWNSGIKRMSREQRALSVEFEVPYLWVGRKYTFRVVGFNTDPSGGSSIYTCPIGPSSTEINDLGILEEQLITKDTTQVVIKAYSGFSATDSCGFVGAKVASCYDLSNQPEATLKNGTRIKLVTNSRAFSYWQEKTGSRILKATGIWNSDSDWQFNLKPKGMEFDSSYFTHVTDIAGRVCPINVYYDSSTKTKTNHCLYHTLTLGATTLDTEVPSGVVAEDYLQSWTQDGTGNTGGASWYEGNIKRCKQLGMRLPTFYEFSVPSNATVNGFQPSDALPPPQWTTTGIPVNTSTRYLTATASASTNPNGNIKFFQVEDFGGVSVREYDSSDQGYVICVLP